VKPELMEDVLKSKLLLTATGIQVNWDLLGNLYRNPLDCGSALSSEKEETLGIHPFTPIITDWSSRLLKCQDF
jgi:hypothetical protein